VTVTVAGIKEAGQTEIQPLLCRVARAVAMMTGLAVQVISCYWQIQQEKLCNCHWATSVSHTVFTIRFLSEYSGGNFAPAAYHYGCVTNGHGVCPIAVPCFHVPEV